MKPIPHPYRNGDCFFCGTNNPAGLKLTFFETDAEPIELICRWTPPAMFKGFGQVLHGGIQSGLFDEIMGWTTLHITGKVGVTASLQIQFLKPVFVEHEIEVRCRIDSIDGDKTRLSAEIRSQNDLLCTRAEGTYILMDRSRFAQIVGEV